MSKPTEQKKVDVELTCDKHTHAGTEYIKGDTISCSPGAAKWLVDNEKGKLVKTAAASN